MTIKYGDFVKIMSKPTDENILKDGWRSGMDKYVDDGKTYKVTSSPDHYDVNRYGGSYWVHVSTLDGKHVYQFPLISLQLTHQFKVGDKVVVTERPQRYMGRWVTNLDRYIGTGEVFDIDEVEDETSSDGVVWVVLDNGWCFPVDSIRIATGEEISAIETKKAAEEAETARKVKLFQDILEVLQYAVKVQSTYSIFGNVSVSVDQDSLRTAAEKISETL